MFRVAGIVCFICIWWLNTGFITRTKSLVSAKPPVVDTAGPNQPHSDKLLFYLHRSTNNNIIIYELNTDKEGNPLASEPIHGFWIRNTENGDRAELSYIQKKFAYGIQHRLSDAAHHSYRVNFVSYNKKQILVAKSKTDNHYHAYIDLNNRQIQLTKIFVKIEGGTFWFPNVPYIEITGKDVATGLVVKERIKP